MWWTGNETSSLQGAANLADSFCKRNGGPVGWAYEEDLDDGYTTHAPVGSYKPNPLGLHDVAGNVWEWCQSSPKEYPYDPSDGREELEASVGRVVRGGGWDFGATDARSASRLKNSPGDRSADVGLRPARTVE